MSEKRDNRMCPLHLLHRGLVVARPRRWWMSLLSDDCSVKDSERSSEGPGSQIEGGLRLRARAQQPRKSPAASFRIRVPGQIRLVGADAVLAHDREIA